MIANTMAFYDPARGAVTIRIVYDGLGMAGKTTNVRQIYQLYTVARSGEVIVPGELLGRTLYFDWLELDAGYIGEHRLRCQLLTVPGQMALIERRWALLRTPDAVVEVCDCSPAGLGRSVYAMKFLRAMLDAGSCPDVPLLVQANKQDAPGSLNAAGLARLLSLEPAVRVVEAIASRGDGVRPTLMFALQAARERTQQLIDEHGIAALPVGGDGAEALYEKMLRMEELGESREGAILADKMLDAESQ